ncbi:MAG: hypothetical protein AB1492_01240 [Bacillota bacterium]
MAGGASAGSFAVLVGSPISAGQTRMVAVVEVEAVAGPRELQAGVEPIGFVAASTAGTLVLPTTERRRSLDRLFRAVPEALGRLAQL